MYYSSLGREVVLKANYLTKNIIITDTICLALIHKNPKACDMHYDILDMVVEISYIHKLKIVVAKVFVSLFQ